MEMGKDKYRHPVIRCMHEGAKGGVTTRENEASLTADYPVLGQALGRRALTAVSLPLLRRFGSLCALRLLPALGLRASLRMTAVAHASHLLSRLQFCG